MEYCSVLSCANLLPCSSHELDTAQSIAARKVELRARVRQRLREAQLDPEAAGREIARHLSGLDEWKSAQRVSVFFSYGSEPDTAPVILQAFADRKTVLLPSWRKEGLRMEMVPTSQEEYERLKQQGKALPMPAMTGRWEPVDLFVVPGLCFDRGGGRLGHGWGYYDRYFAAYRSHFGGLPPTAGIAHPCQVEAEPVPRDEHDCLLRLLVTPEGCIRCKE